MWMRGDIFCHCSSFQLFELNDRGRQYFALHKFFLYFILSPPFFCQWMLVGMDICAVCF